MGLPWEYHERCRMSLETHFLQRFFTHACSVAREVAASGRSHSFAGVVRKLRFPLFFPEILEVNLIAAEFLGAVANGGDAGVCLACINLLTAILTWDFKRGGGGMGGGGFGFIPVSFRAPCCLALTAWSPTCC